MVKVDPMTLLPAQAFRISVSTAVTTIDTATWIVATGTLVAYEWSACAIACGVPAALRAVLDAAAR